MKLPSSLRAINRDWLPLIMTGIIGVLLLVLCMWSWTEWRSAREETDGQLDLYRRYGTLAKQEGAIEAAVKTYGGYLTVSKTPDEAFHQLLQLVEQTASAASLQITGLKPRPVAPADGTTSGRHSRRAAVEGENAGRPAAQHAIESAEYTVELECSGSMAALAQFMQTLEYGPALLRVNRLRINPDPRGENLLQAQLLITYTNIL